MGNTQVNEANTNVDKIEEIKLCYGPQCPEDPAYVQDPSTEWAIYMF